jgi:hypothetical protein
VIQFAPGLVARSAAENAGAKAFDGNAAVPAVVCPVADESRGIADTEAASKRATADPRSSTRFSLIFPPG